MSATRQEIKKFAKDCGLTANFSVPEKIYFQIGNIPVLTHEYKSLPICKKGLQKSVNLERDRVFKVDPKWYQILVNFSDALACPKCQCKKGELQTL